MVILGNLLGNSRRRIHPGQVRKYCSHNSTTHYV